jgi:GMP synthase-like glutamine amidotransferase
MWGVQFHPEVTLSDSEAIVENRPIPLHPWDPQFDVKAPYLIKAFSEICGAVNSRIQP